MSETGGKDGEARNGKRGRPFKLGDAELAVLRDVCLASPGSTVDELIAKLDQAIGVRVTPRTLVEGLRRAGVTRVRRIRSSATTTTGTESKRYGYGQSHRDEGSPARYPSSLTDAEWMLVADLFETKGRGKPPQYPRRVMLDACCYVVRSGCSWRMLPKGFPPWNDVYKTFRRWVSQGRFEHMHDRLRGLWRVRERRAVDPSAGVLDSQSVKTSPQGGPKGFDANKKVKGRKRHLLVDTLGLLLAVLIQPACVQDRDGALPVVTTAMCKYPSLKTLFVDSGYAGTCARTIHASAQLNVEVVRRPRWTNQPSLFSEPAFPVLPKRWVVERTNAWNDRPRRQAKDHDRRLDVSAAWIWLSEARILGRRLTTSA